MEPEPVREQTEHSSVRHASACREGAMSEHDSGPQARRLTVQTTRYLTVTYVPGILFTLIAVGEIIPNESNV